MTRSRAAEIEEQQLLSAVAAFQKWRLSVVKVSQLTNAVMFGHTERSLRHLEKRFGQDQRSLLSVSSALSHVVALFL